MAPNTLWKVFRKFRLIVLAIAAVLSLTWSIIITVYMAKNWSSYDTAQRGFLFVLIGIHFIGSILLYLMIVVQYHFWPDAARTTVLWSLYIASSVTFMIYSSSFPCNAFGSSANCHIMTMVVTIGSWVVSALLAAYVICLPIMAFVPRPSSATQDDDLENLPDMEEVGEDMRKSHVSSTSRAWLLNNPEGMSPEVHESELPIPPNMLAAHRTYSNSSSWSSSHVPQQVNRNLEGVNPASVYSQSIFADTVRGPDNANRGLKSSGSLSSAQYPLRSNSKPFSPLANRFVGEPMDANRVSVASSSFESSYELPVATPTIAEAPHRTPSTTTTESSASVYSQNTVHAPSRMEHTSADASQAPRSNPLASDAPGRLSVHSMMASVHGHVEPQFANYDTTSNGFLSPPLTALPTPRFSAGPSENSFELHLNFPRREPEEETDLLTLHGPVERPALVRPSINHVRTDSTTSSVDLNEWKRLVLNAAGRGH